METFWEFLQKMQLEGGLWANPPALDSPGTKRKDAKHPYNHRFGGDAMGGGMPMPGNPSAQPQMPPQMQPKKAKK